MNTQNNLLRIMTVRHHGDYIAKGRRTARNSNSRSRRAVKRLARRWDARFECQAEGA